MSETVLFRLATEAPLSVFSRILLVSAAGDRYVSPHSARVENAKQAFSDKVNGQSNIELVERLQRDLEHSKATVERYHVIHQGLPQGDFLTFAKLRRSRFGTDWSTKKIF